MQGHFRLNIHNTFLDHLITELQDRVCISLGGLCAEMFILQHISSLTDNYVDEIKTGYGAFINSKDFDATGHPGVARAFDTSNINVCNKIALCIFVFHTIFEIL